MISMISAALAEPVTASHSGAQNRPKTAVRVRNCRISAGWRLSTSSARKSTMNRLSLDPGREVRQQEGDLVVAAVIADDVIVVQHHNNRGRELG